MTADGLPTWWTREVKTSNQLQHGNLWSVFVRGVAKHLSQKENVLEDFFVTVSVRTLAIRISFANDMPDSGTQFARIKVRC
jgi:hypothetical protein